jgi:hypothetical protein
VVGGDGIESPTSTELVDMTQAVEDFWFWQILLKKSFGGGGQKFSRGADAFRARRCEGPRRISEKRPRTFVSALRRIPTMKLSKNQHLRDFWGRSIFDFRNSICQ